MHEAFMDAVQIEIYVHSANKLFIFFSLLMPYVLHIFTQMLFKYRKTEMVESTLF